MFDRILKRMREKIRTRRYVMTLHAEEEMDDDGLLLRCQALSASNSN